MSGHKSLWIAAIGNCLVAGATIALRGWNAAGAHAAARNAARFSALWFLAAFGAPGLVRVARAFHDEAEWIRAFVAAHFVHFGVVAVLILTFDSAHLRSNPASAAATILLGFAIVLAAALTGRSRPSRFYTVVRRFILYTIFLIFLLAFINAPVRPLRLFAIPLVFAFALLVRLWDRRSDRGSATEVTI